ncbi:MAG: hypothetical protein JNL72_13400 [Flavipsychrobacter sp.]|nr:hypothetical protein [Flavipsychrobacter sp.]
MRPKFVFLLPALLWLAHAASAGAPPPVTGQYKNNSVTYHCEADTTVIEDPETGFFEYRIVRTEVMRLNNRPVYCDERACEPVGCANQCDLATFLKELWKEELYRLKGKTEHFYTQVVIGDDGKLAYFEPHLKLKKRPYTAQHDLDDLLCSMETKLEKVTFAPAWIGGEAVPYSLSVDCTKNNNQGNLVYLDSK